MNNSGVTEKKKRAPLWVPSLYFAQGFPYTTVMEMAPVFFKSIGLSLEALGIFQGLLGLPWAFKFLWSPLVELVGRKRTWIAVMQGLLVALFAALVYFAVMPTGGHPVTLGFVMPNGANPLANILVPLGLLGILFTIAFGIDKSKSPPARLLCLVAAATIPALFYIFRADLFVSFPVTEALPIWLIFGGLLMMAVASATQDIAIDGYYMDALDKAGQSAFSGIRVMFYRIAMVVGGGLLVMLAGKNGWPVAFAAAAIVFSVFYLLNLALMPRRIPFIEDVVAKQQRSFAESMTSYLGQNRIVVIILFILLFRLGDFLWKPMSKPFLMDIGVTVTQLGFLQGTLGVIATILGGILGGIYISRRGLTRGLWVLGIIQNVTLLLYALLGHIHRNGALKVADTMHFAGYPLDVMVINTFENFAYGLGTIAFVNFLMRTCKKEYNASHYAIATGLMAISTMTASFFSGFIAKEMGYTEFFTFCFFAAIPGLCILPFLPLKRMEQGD